MDFKIARKKEWKGMCCRGGWHMEKPGHIDEIVMRTFQTEQDAINKGFELITSHSVSGFMNFMIDSSYQIYTNGPFPTREEAIESGNKHGDYIATLEIKDENFLPQTPVLALVP